MSPHPLANFEIQKYYQNEPKVNGVYSRNNLPKVKVGAYVTSLVNYKSIGTHWITLSVNSCNVTYFEDFGVEYIQEKLKN